MTFELRNLENYNEVLKTYINFLQDVKNLSINFQKIQNMLKNNFFFFIYIKPENIGIEYKIKITIAK